MLYPLSYGGAKSNSVLTTPKGRDHSRGDPAPSRGGYVLLDFVQLTGGDVKDKASNRIGVRNEGAVLDALDGLTHIFVQIGEGLGSPLGLDASLGLDTSLEVVVGEGQHSAVRVVDEDDFLGAEQSLADGQRADLVIGDDSTSITNHVRFALA